MNYGVFPLFPVCHLLVLFYVHITRNRKHEMPKKKKLDKSLGEFHGILVHLRKRNIERKKKFY